MPSSGLKSFAKSLCPPLLWRAARSSYLHLAPPPPPPVPPPPAPPLPYRLLSTLAEVDAEFDLIRNGAKDHDDFLRRLDDFRLRPPTDLPDDPASPEYRDAQMRFYHLVSGRDQYRAEVCEQLKPETPHVEPLPFPYYTRSCLTVGEQLMAVGFLIRALRLAPGGRVLEYGPGYGLLTLELARTQFHVTGVDVNPQHLEQLGQRCRREELDVRLVCSTMLDFRPDERFDRVVFYESFHHCADPEAMVARLADQVAEGGMVAFAGEPVSDDFPMPWGLRPDGRALWAIRTQGWLELGFRTDYFLGLLAKHGWAAEVFDCADVPWQRVFVARRAA